MSDDIVLSSDAGATSGLNVPVVGVGASAGGLEAFTELLQALTVPTGMAFVFVQHLDPNHPSMLPEILSRVTPLPVTAIAQRTRLEPNHVYVIPPNSNVAVQDGELVLSPRGLPPKQFMPIDFFMRSLASARGNRAIGVLLSGGGTDGALGVQEIKGGGGIVFAQDEQTAKQGAMPRSGVSTGCTDFVLPPADIAREIARVGRALDEGVVTTDRFVVSDAELQQIFGLLRRSAGADFSSYKRTTIKRRIHRRINLTGVETAAAYLQLLDDKPAELQALFQDFLIGVTSFFRDPGAYETLATKIFPKLIADRAPDAPIRFWIAGCATGEEVYSLAITLLECLGDMVNNTPIKILATDLNEAALERARAGVYIDNIALDVSQARLRRFFVKVNGHYQISQSIRDLCVFSKHNLAKDPPFANIDLISCRNLLIYFDTALQKRVIPYFHYALKPSGVLMLGTSETVGEYVNLFEPIDKENKLYEKKFARVKPSLEFPVLPMVRYEPDDQSALLNGQDELRTINVQREAERLLLARFVPPSVIVDASYNIVHFRGQIGRFLNPVTGAASLDLLKMVREELLLSLRRAFEQAKLARLPVKTEARIVDREQTHAVTLEVIPLPSVGGAPACFVVLFEDGGLAEEPLQQIALEAPSDMSAELRRRDQELSAMRDYLQSVVEQHEVTSEELKAANEEILSSNEELQSTNEELQTAKEEMQSTNEELATVNEELTHRNRDLSHVNDDLVNLLGGLNMPIIVVNRELLIRRFTPPAEDMFNLISGDVGRPISDLRTNLRIDDLRGLIDDVMHSLKPLELEVQDNDGKWHSLRIRPYITSDRRIDGATLAVVEIDQLKRSAGRLEASRDYADAIVETIWEPLIVLDRELKVSRANASFYRTFHTTPSVVQGESFLELDGGRFKRLGIAQRLHAVLADNERIQDLEVELPTSNGESQTLSLNAQRILKDGDDSQSVLLSLEDITNHKRSLQHSELLAKEQIAREQAETASRVKDEFLAMLAHELRNPLAPVRNTLYILRKRFANDQLTRSAVELSQRQISHMARLLDDLLDVSRITRGKIQLRRELVELQVTVRDALETCRQHFDSNRQSVELSMPNEPLFIEADPARIEQVLSNLLHNAAKYTNPHGHIWVSVAVDGDDVLIRVKDDGVGISHEMLPRVFDLFLQVDRSLDRAQGGLGIGLTLVKTLVAMHGGSVEAKSAGINRGSEFSVRLPRTLYRGRDSVAPPSDAPATPLHVLVVDDNVDAAATLTMALEMYEHQVETVHSAFSAIELAQAHKPDVILLDIGLPELDGYQVAARLRQDPSLDNTTIIAITGYGQEEDRRRSRDAGIDHHLVKPIDLSEMMGLLRDSLRKPKPN